MDQKVTSTQQPKKRRKRKRKRRRKNRQNLEQKLQRADLILEDPKVLADPKVQKLLVQAQQAKSSKEMLEYHLLLEQFLLQEYSTLDDPDRSDELSFIRADAATRDQAEDAFEQDKAGFLEDVYTRSESKKLTGDAAERAKANATKMYKMAKNNKLAERHNKRLELDWMIANGPTRDVNAEGQWIQLGSVPDIQRVLRPDVVRIMHRSYELKPGLNKDVPEIFAQQYDLILQSRQETRAREDALKIHQEAGKLETALMAIDQKYGVRRQLVTGTA